MLNKIFELNMELVKTSYFQERRFKFVIQNRFNFISLHLAQFTMY